MKSRRLKTFPYNDQISYWAISRARAVSKSDISLFLYVSVFKVNVKSVQ
jgi:hypothetical protein